MFIVPEDLMFIMAGKVRSGRNRKLKDHISVLHRKGRTQAGSRVKS